MVYAQKSKPHFAVETINNIFLILYMQKII